MSKTTDMVTLPLELLEQALAALPEGTAAARGIRDCLARIAEEAEQEPVAYLAQRLTGK